jgi:hypothetical protein
MAQLSESLARDAIRRIRSNHLHCLTANEIDQALWAWLMLNGFEPRPTQETEVRSTILPCGCDSARTAKWIRRECGCLPPERDLRGDPTDI